MGSDFSISPGTPLSVVHVIGARGKGNEGVIRTFVAEMTVFQVVQELASLASFKRYVSWQDDKPLDPSVAREMTLGEVAEKKVEEGILTPEAVAAGEPVTRFTTERRAVAA